MNPPIRALIVDDEESARDVLENLLRRFCPSVEVLHKYANLPEAVTGVQHYQPDIVFLDIEMPNYAGYEILDFFDEIDFDIIFVTAFDSYAVKAFEVAAVDYLLKPVDVQRLKEAVAKAGQLIGARAISQQFEILKESLSSNQVRNLVVSEKGDQYIVPVADIIAIEAQEAYSKLHTPDKAYVASKNLKHFQGLLTHNAHMFRTHKSWIVNLDRVVKYNKSKGEILLSDGLTAKLSKYRKEEFEAAFLKR